VTGFVSPARVLVADPPWEFNDVLPGPGRGAAKHYDVLTLDQIKAFPLPHMQRDSLLFMWRVSSQVEEAYQVVRAWGFEPKSEIVWEKLTDPIDARPKRHFGMGHYVRLEHESCIIATRGSPDIKDRSIRSTFKAPIGVHSAKPDEFYQMVQQLSFGPFVELFARTARVGWRQYGNEMERAHP
jgi:N6-adenosine-specific RNA methylase IME4